DSLEPKPYLILGQAIRVAVNRVFQARAGDILHHDPRVARFVVANVVEIDEVRMLEVEALPDAAQLNLQIALDMLERQFLTRIARREINLAKPTAANAALNDKAFQRSRSAGVLKL